MTCIGTVNRGDRPSCQLCILAGSMVLQFTGRSAGPIEGVVEFAVGQQSGIAGDLDAEEAEPETTVESGSKGLGWVVLQR